MNTDSCFKIAYVVKTHGLKGEITISLLPDCPDLTTLKSVFIEVKDQLVPYFIQSVTVKATKAYVRLEDIRTSDEAGLLTGRSIYIPKKDRPALPKGEFYGDEVTGFDVADNVHGPLGKVREVLEIGANRHLIVEYLGREVMIPMNGPFIRSVNKTKRKFTVELPEGFLEI